SEGVRARTTDNARSGFLALLNTGSEYSGVFDSFFVSQAGTPLYSNFYITAFVQPSGSGVAGVTESSPINISPNPAALNLEIDGIIPGSSIELFDMLGRKVLMATI